MLLGLARSANLEGEHDLSLRYCQQAIELIESGAVDADGVVRGTAYQSTGAFLHWLNRHAEAERHMRKALVEYERAGGPDHPFAIDGKRELGAFLTWVGRRTEAKELLTAALTAQERAKGPDDPELTAYARVDLARVLVARGELAAAEPQLVRAVASWRASTHPTAIGILQLARIQIGQGRLAEAEDNLRDIEPAVIEVWGQGSWTHGATVNRMGELRFAQDRSGEALGYFDRVWNDWSDAPGEVTANRAHARLGRIRIHLAARELRAAQELATALLPAIEKSPGRADMPDEEAAAHMLLGVALMEAGDAASAKAHLERAVSMRERMDAPASPWLAEARLWLAQDRYLSNDRAEARRLLDLAVQAHQAQGRLGAQHQTLLAQTRNLLASVR